jgi:N-methylhydantoinase B
VLGGFVSRESAERDYGVVLSGNAIDVQATSARRRSRPASKLYHRHAYTDTLE